MYEVKRIEAQDLYAELRHYAFERSPALKLNELRGYEEQRIFYHDDPVPDVLNHKMGKEICKTTFEFSVFRSGHVRNKRSFVFTLAARIERTLEGLDPYRLSLLDTNVVQEYDGFEEIDEGVLSEASEVEFELEGHTMREISVDQGYSIGYMGNTIYHRSTNDVLYGMEGDAVPIPPIESEDNVDSYFIPKPITHEQLPAVDNVITNIGFWALVEPFGLSLDQGVDYRSAASQMRAILTGLQTGITY